MKALQIICGEYQEEDIYNMEESGLFWKNRSSKGLASKPQLGVKKKNRISLVV